MEGLIETTPIAPRAGKTYPFTPVARLLGERQLKVVLVAVAILSPFTALYFVRSSIDRLIQPRTVMAIDGSGTIHMGPLTPIDPTSELFKLLAIQATQAFFLRNPNGLTNAELAEKLFTPEALDLLKEDVSKEQATFKRNDFYQMCEVTSYKPVDLIDGVKLTFVTRGFLTRAGAINGLATRPRPIYYALSMELIENPDMGNRGSYPFRIARWARRWEDGGGHPLKEGDGE